MRRVRRSILDAEVFSSHAAEDEGLEGRSFQDLEARRQPH